MATIKNGVFGSISGRIGNVIYFNRNGRGFVRSLPRASKKPASVKQLEQRAKFRLVTGFLSPFKPLIDIGFKCRKQDFSAMNTAVAYHLREGIKGAFPDYEMDLSRFMFSKGRLIPPVSATAVRKKADQISFSWADHQKDIFSSPADQAVALLFNPSLNQHLIIRNVAARADGQFVFPIPEYFRKGSIHCWLGFFDQAGNQASNSICLGKV